MHIKLTKPEQSTLSDSVLNYLTKILLQKKNLGIIKFSPCYHIIQRGQICHSKDNFPALQSDQSVLILYTFPVEVACNSNGRITKLICSCIILFAFIPHPRQWYRLWKCHNSIIPELFKMARLRTESTGNLISISILLFVALKPMWIMPKNMLYIQIVYFHSFCFQCISSAHYISEHPFSWVHSYLSILWPYYWTFHIFIVILITHRFISADYHYRSRSHITLYHETFLKKKKNLRPQWQ